MCGIIGVVSNVAQESTKWIMDGLILMNHRGPDYQGEWWSNDLRVGLGHCRLAIVDTTVAGHQPMQNSNRTHTIVFNGEIYNHQIIRRELLSLGHVFRTHSDTEVLLNAFIEWGVDCLNKINGMFAFAIYDSINKKMFLARDRAGEKPLFYKIENGVLFFSSELKGIMCSPNFTRKIDKLSLDCYLALGYVPNDMCIIKGVNKLPPANALIFDVEAGSAKRWKYWELPQFKQDNDTSVGDLLREFEDILQSAVSLQMQADVPVGVLLSGGLDSSIITAMAARCSDKVRTYNISFPGFARYDESRHAKLISNHFSTIHTELVADPGSVSLLPILAKQYDEPMVDSSSIPTYLVSRLVGGECKVALGGDGADELFGGYASYSRILRMRRLGSMLPNVILDVISDYVGTRIPEGVKGRNYIREINCNMVDELPFLSRLFDIKQRIELMAEVDDYSLCAETIRQKLSPKSGDLLDRSLRYDFENYLPEDILVKVDRASMLNSLEVRAPFLDYRIIEFAFGKIGTTLKASHKNKKIFLKKFASSVLPEQFDYSRKQGFSIPLDAWLRSGPYRDFIYETLVNQSSIFNKNVILRLLKGLDNGLANGERLFALVQFELWRRNYGAYL